MKYVLMLAVLLAGCSGNPLPSYEQLKAYPLSCKQKDTQIAELQNIQIRKNFAEDPDDLSNEDRQYNAVLKDHLWWFIYKCKQ